MMPRVDEDPDGLAHRRTADTEPLSESALALESVTELEPLRADHRLDLLDDGLIRLCAHPASWLPCGWTTGIVWSNHSLVERSPERTTMASPLVKQRRRFPRPRDLMPLLQFKKPTCSTRANGGCKEL